MKHYKHNKNQEITDFLLTVAENVAVSILIATITKGRGGTIW